MEHTKSTRLEILWFAVVLALDQVYDYSYRDQKLCDDAYDALLWMYEKQSKPI